MAAIYSFMNKTNFKRCVGQFKNPTKRMKEHLIATQNGNPRPLYSAIRKCGIDNFVFEILEECEIEQLNDREQFWVCHFGFFNREKGYNLTTGGKQCQFGPMLEDHKRKIGEANKISKKRYKLSEDHKQKNSESKKGTLSWNKGGTSNEKYDLKIDKRHEQIVSSAKSKNGTITKKIKLILKRAHERGNL
jgi:group I intron endonuclease